MHFHVTIPTIMLAAALLTAVVITVISLRHSSGAGGSEMTLVLAAMALYLGASMLETAVRGTVDKVFFSKIQVTGFASLAPLLLMFSLKYTHRDSFIQKGRWVLLWILPLVFVVSAWTNELHQLVWTGYSKSLEARGVLTYHHGPVYYAIIGIVYAYAIVSMVVMLLHLKQAIRIQKWQIILMVVSILIPLFAGILYIGDLPIFKGLDPTPISLVGTVLILSFAIARRELLNLIPISRSVLIDKMQDGFLVVDSECMVVDQNKAASLFPGIPENCLGSNVERVFENYPGIVDAVQTGQEVEIQVPFRDNPIRAVLVRTRAIHNRHDRKLGTLVFLHDDTSRYLSHCELESVNRSLQDNLQEIRNLKAQLEEQVIRDPLTGLFNRRYLQETLPREIARSERRGVPLTAVMIDLDHFKSINDRFGHNAGDHFLVAFSSLLKRHVRQSDFVCRYGGEEFLVVFYGLPLDVSVRRIDELRKVFKDMVFDYGGQSMDRTFSAGVASYPTHARDGKELIEAADRALYRAKQQGRNRVAAAAIPGFSSSS